ncbi:hypothetical protein EJ08DRAFT_490121 [Tothia fuscella]|uniref:SH3 domain-containing protein n=1 Tax=Tothia fuscella TaxID=1048955 RepID=A0A9P4NHD8_9PEZI|nr:hypothetical protein EJ08DRAFT_490121 [Tothia fuscella]
MRIRSLLEGIFHREAHDNVLQARQKKGGVLTLVSLVTMTAPKTFDGPATYSTVAGGALLQSRTEEAAPTTDSGSAETSAAAPSTSEAAAATSAAPETNHEHSSFASTTLLNVIPVAASTSSPMTTSLESSPTFGSPASASASASATKEATAPQQGGMTGGAKAGLAFGILFLLGALLAGAFMLYRRKKQQQEHEQLDDEKSAIARPDALPQHAQPDLPPVPTSQAYNAPQLSVRPVTQFDPQLSSPTGPGAAVAGAAGVGAAALAAKNVTRTPSPNSNSAWEKRGAERHANDPQNPFGNHAETLNGSPPNGAAIAAGAVGGALAAGATKRSPSPGHIEAADFPLPVSGPPSPNPISLQSEGSGISTGPTVSTISIPASLQPGEAATIAGGAAVAGAAIAGGAAAASKSAPNTDNVYRVQLDFKPSMEDELEIRAGQVVRMLHEYDDGWALCTLMDRSQQGVVPRTCLSKTTVKARPAGPAPQGRPNGPPRGSPQMRSPGGPMGPSGHNSPRPMTPQGRPDPPSGRNSPAPYPGGRASPAFGGRASPAPYAQAPRPLSPAGRPAGRARAASNASPYAPYNPNQRSQSPGPYGAGQLKPTQRPENQRRRSNSMSNMAPPNMGSPPTSSPLSASSIPPLSQIPMRKPVPGQAK